MLQRCAAGAHIVFIGTSGLLSMVMRGQLTHSILNQSFAAHGATSSYIQISAPMNTSKKESNMIENHFDSIGSPAACVIIKYSVEWVGHACRRRGALVLVDTVDNPRAYSKSTLGNEHYSAMDAILVQTELHAAMVASWGHVAVVLPHPHGNLWGWSVADHVRPRIRGVGFVAQDAKNMPTQYDMRILQRACCRANVTLYLVSTRANGMQIQPSRHRNCSGGVWDDGNSRAAMPQTSLPSLGESQGRAHSCHARHGNASSSRHSFSSRAGLHGSGGTSAALSDPTHQRQYYESSQLLELIDVGVVWRPGHQHGGKIAIDNRPPTRMHWWWSHGIPVIGYPMQAYLDAARRARYPEDLLNLTTSERVESVLLRIDAQEERRCLQRVAHHGAHISSPWYAALELLAAICTVGERCGRRLQLAHGRPAAVDSTHGSNTPSLS
jgi:hypothetical protein